VFCLRPVSLLLCLFGATMDRGDRRSSTYVCEHTNARIRKEVAMGLFVKVGTIQELEALEAGKLV
jgi:hypothetical protein